MSRKTIKITATDNFVWKVLTEQEAKEVMESGTFSLYALYGDDSEALINDYEELGDILANNIEVGIEVGFIRTTTKSEVV